MKMENQLKKKKIKPCKLCGGKRIGNLTICWNCFRKREKAKKELKIAKLKERRVKRVENSVWSFKKADGKFSEFIRNRDGECQRCHRKDRQLQCSHFWDRQWYATRFDPDNCCALCSWCHTFDRDSWQEDRLGEYKEFMIAKLGVEGYNKLKEKHKQFKSKRDAILEVMKFFK